MRHLVLLSLALVLVSPAQAQTEEGCTQWWCRWGVARDTVDARVEAMRSSHDVEVPVNTEERVCVDWGLIENKACYMFDEEGLSAYSSTSYNRSVEGIGKEMAGASRSWGDPIAYYADFTPVDSWGQAVQLADPRAEVHFISEEIGTVYQLIVDTSGKGSTEEGTFTQLELYEPAERYRENRP